jgi:hypothetical protein
MALQGIFGRDGHVVKKAKAHGFVAASVVPRWAHGAKGVFQLSGQHGVGGIQRGIDAEGVAADLSEFKTQLEFPYKQLQFQRDMISGLPSGSVTNSPAQLSGIAQLVSSVGGIDALLKATGQKDLGTMLKNLGLNFGGGETE